MRITRTSGKIIIQDRPGPSWGLGLFLLAGGVVSMAMPLGLATNAADLQPWERLASFGIGGSQRWEVAFGEVRIFQAEQGVDGDGSPAWRPTALLWTGETIALSELWSHDRLGIAEAVTIMSQASELPSPSWPKILVTPGQQDG